MTERKSRVDSSALSTSTAVAPVWAYHSACAVVHKAICAEAICILLALHELSREGGVIELADELRRCQPSGRGEWDSLDDASDAAGALSVSRSQRLTNATADSRGDQPTLSPTAAARDCIAHASLYSLLTAAHLLRCPTWTASTVAPNDGPDVTPAGVSTAGRRHLAQARAAAELRTREPAWCATALVQVADWLLASRRRLAPRSHMSSLMRRALCVAEPVGRRAAATAGGTKANGTETCAARSSAGASAIAAGCGCEHRWLLEDLPRWCVQVALAEQSRAWYIFALRRRALGRWRARRGLRVVARLADAAAFDDGRKMPSPSRTAATQTPAHPPHTSESRAAEVLEPPAWGTDDVLATSVSVIPVEAAPPLSVESQYLRRGGDAETQTASAAQEAEDTSTAALVKASLLDSVLRGVPSSQDAAAPTTGDEVDSPANVSVVPRQHDTPAPPHEAAPVAGLLTDTAAAATWEELVRRLTQRRNAAVLQRAFCHWRDHRLYEALAVRFLETQRREAMRVLCWARWVRRRAALRQRDKEARDVVRCDTYTEQKALEYFRTLLRRWRVVATVRRFQLSTTGHRAFRAWVCQTRFAHAQRATQQLLVVGARRVTAQLWTRWRERYLESVADRHHARRGSAAALLRMKAVCDGLRDLRRATAHHSAALLRRAVRRWTQRCALAAQVARFADAAQPHHAVVRQAWGLWRSRWRGRRQRHDDEARLGAFRAAQLLRRCLVQWVRRWRLEALLQACVSARQRRYVVRPLLLRWHERAQVRLVVRQGQEDLARRVGVLLLQRAVLHTWRRRAAQHALCRHQGRYAQQEAEAEQVARRNRAARAFYRWRTRSLLLWRYDIDRRRCLHAAATSTGTHANVDACRPAAGTHRHRAIALQRLLLVAQAELTVTPLRCTRPLVSGQPVVVRHRARDFTSTSGAAAAAAAPRRSKQPDPARTVSWGGDADCFSDSEDSALRRSATATPIASFAAGPPQRRASTSRPVAALVDSPHSAPPPPRTGANRRGGDGGVPGGAPARRLLGQMERLLCRIRAVEAEHRPATGVSMR